MSSITNSDPDSYKIPDELIENICNIGICLSHSELLSTIFGGFLTGGSAIGIFILQRHIERKANRYDTCEILLNEIRTILFTILAKKPDLFEKPEKILPTSEIYHGLLSSGNIKYFDADLQKKLNKFYNSFKNFPKSPDHKNGRIIVDSLEEIKKNNQGYRQSFSDFLKNS